jgi:hypothetical protein
MLDLGHFIQFHDIEGHRESAVHHLFTTKQETKLRMTIEFKIARLHRDITLLTSVRRLSTLEVVH